MKLSVTFKRADIIRTAIFLGVLVLTLVIDLITKGLTDGRKGSVHNDGIAFGLFSNARVFFIVTNVFLTLGAFAAWFFFILVRKENILFNIGFALFISGAIGNLYDRIAFGYVRDFINLPFFPPVFNIADACLTIGTGVFIFAFFVGSFKKVKNAA